MNASRFTGGIVVSSTTCFVALISLVAGTAAQAQVTLTETPMGALASQGGGGHYQHVPIFTPDAQHVFLLVGQGSKMAAYVDGIAGPTVMNVNTFTSPGSNGTVAGRSPSFSEDGTRIGYVATVENNKSMVVINGSASPVYDRVNWFGFAPAGHHFAYVAQHDAPQGAVGKMADVFAVDDGKAGLTYGSVGSPEFSSDGKHFAYVGISQPDPNYKPVQNVTPQRGRIVLDGKEQSARFELIKNLKFSKDGNHLAYIAGTDGFTPTRVVVDDKVGKTYVGVDKLFISDDGSRVVYAAIEGNNSLGQKSFLVDNGTEGARENAISEVALSPDGKRAAYYALGTGGGSVVENGQKGTQYRQIQSLRYTPDSSTLIYQATSAQGTFIVANGKEIGPFSQVMGQMASSQDGHHWACCVQKMGGSTQYAIVEDGKEVEMQPGVGPGDLKYQEGTGRLIMMSRTTSMGAPVAIDVNAPPVPVADVPSDLAYSPSKQHWIKVMTQGDGSSQPKQRVSIDDQPAMPQAYANIKKLAISDDGKHYGFIGTMYGAAAGSLTHAMYDGKEGPSYNSIWDLALSPDGQHVAYVAQDGPGSTGNWYVVIDGIKGPAFEDVLPYTSYQDGDHRLKFESDGSLRFFACSNNQLVRCTYAPGSFNGLPTMAAVESDKPGLKVLHTWEGPGHTALGMAMGPGDTIYGVCIGEGKFHKGMLYSMKSDGSDYTVLHDFFGGDVDGEEPQSLIIEPDGKLLGTLQQGKVFRYDPKSKEYALVNVNKENDYGPVIIVGEAGGKVVGMGGGPGPQYREMFSMNPDGSGYATVDNSQYAKPLLRMYSQMIPAKDGSFFAVGGGSKATLVKFKDIKDTPTVVHNFVNSPTDGSSPDADLTLDSKGNLYGTTSNGGNSQHGVIYRVDADGSNYKVICNPDDFKFSKLIAAGDDGKLYGMTPEGLLAFDPATPDKTTVAVAFTGKPDMNTQGLPHVVFHEGAVYAMTNKAIYRVPVGAPRSNPASAAPTVAVQNAAPTVLLSEAIAFTAPSGAGSAAGGAPSGPAAQQPPQAQNQAPRGNQPQQNSNTNQANRQNQNPTQNQNRGNNALNRAQQDAQRARDAANRLRGLFGQ
jgi:uncharacterized repeat protein (TIGR03803 family)